jgi:hypothetical protein
MYGIQFLKIRLQYFFILSGNQAMTRLPDKSGNPVSYSQHLNTGTRKSGPFDEPDDFSFQYSQRLLSGRVRFSKGRFGQ